MQLNWEIGAGTYKIIAYGPEYVQVNDMRIEHSLIISPEKLIVPWEVKEMKCLQIQQLEPALRLEPAVFLLGTGERLTFPSSECYRAILERRIGVEVMDTAAACRTYSVLMAEGRHVVAALLL